MEKGVASVTCAHDGSKHPALAVHDGAEARPGPLGQDVPAARPRGGVHALRVVPRPLPRQNPPVVRRVDLPGNRVGRVQVAARVVLKTDVFVVKRATLCSGGVLYRQGFRRFGL